MTVTIAEYSNKDELEIIPELKKTDRSKHIMYYALQMFYANGGGPWYVISVGGLKAIDDNDLKKGLDESGFEDEPTLILFSGTINAHSRLYDIT
jgi:uncharacterized protein